MRTLLTYRRKLLVKIPDGLNLHVVVASGLLRTDDEIDTLVVHLESLDIEAALRELHFTKYSAYLPTCGGVNRLRSSLLVCSLVTLKSL